MLLPTLDSSPVVVQDSSPARLVAGALAHLGTHMTTGCPRAAYLAAMLLERVAADPEADPHLRTHARDLVEILDQDIEQPAPAESAHAATPAQPGPVATRSRAKAPLLRSGALLAGLAVCGAAHAYHPLITDDTGTQGAGGNQLEFGIDTQRTRQDGETDRERELPLTYTRGLTDDLDVFVGTARMQRPVRGWTNIAAGAKWRFYEDGKAKRSLALKPEIVLPVSKAKELRGLGSGKTSYGLSLLFTQEMPFGELHANLAAERSNSALRVEDFDDPDEYAPERKNRLRLSVAPVWAVTDELKLALDVGMQTNPDKSQKRFMNYVLLGAVYSPSKDLDLGLGFTREGRDGPADTTAATLGLTWRFR